MKLDVYIFIIVSPRLYYQARISDYDAPIMFI